MGLEPTPERRQRYRRALDEQGVEHALGDVVEVAGDCRFLMFDLGRGYSQVAI